MRKWLDALKLAIIEENIEEIETLQHTIPELSTEQEGKEALALLQEAIALTTLKRNDLAQQLQTLKKTRSFTNPYHSNKTQRINFTT